MPAVVRWDENHPNVIITTYSGNWTWDEFYAASKEAQQLAMTVKHRVDIIVDMQQGSFPKQGPAIGAAQNVFRSWPDNAGNLIIVAGSFIQAMVNIFRKMDRKHSQIVFAVKSMAEAYARIEYEQGHPSEPG